MGKNKQPFQLYGLPQEYCDLRVEYLLSGSQFPFWTITFPFSPRESECIISNKIDDSAYIPVVKMADSKMKCHLLGDDNDFDAPLAQP